MALHTSVERKINFYRIDAGTSDGVPVRFDPVPTLEFIRALPPRLDGKYLEWTDGNYLFVDPVSTSFPQKIRLVLSRRRDWPELERDGQMDPLRLPKNGGLGEKIHMMFFGDYVAADFNYYGPRATAVGAYFHLKAKELGPQIRLEHLAKADTIRELKSLLGAVRVELTFRKSALSLVKHANESLFAALRGLGETNAGRIAVVLKTEKVKGKRDYLDSYILEGVESLAREEATYSEFSRLRVKGIESRTFEQYAVDVLDELIVAQRKIVKVDDRSRAVDSESAFAAIEDAFQETRPKLIEASSLLLRS